MNKKRLEMHLIQQKIAPCPWCVEKSIPHMEYGSRFVAECLNEDCPVRPVSKPFSERQEAADAWNSMMLPRWIPVAERLPEVASIHKIHRGSTYTYTKSVRVLCVCVQKDGKRMVKEGYCEIWEDRIEDPNWKIPGTIDCVSHWMPIPEPPKEEI